MNTPYSPNRLAARYGFRSAPRGGLSVLEIIGCLVALVGGVWLGAIYLGIDVRQVTYDALADSKLMETVPEKWRPEVPDSEKAPSQAELAKTAESELAALGQEISALRGKKVAQEDTKVPSSTRNTASESNAAKVADKDTQAKQASLEYWQQLYDVVHRQATLQIGAESGATEGTATKVAALKARICRFSAGAIRTLTTTDVDPAAVKFGNELADWYESGAKLYDEAVQVWESPARAQAGAQLTQEWERKQVQHENEGRLLMDRATAARDSLTRRFGDGFTPLERL